MALPLDLDLVNVRGRYVRLDNTAVTGTVSFAMTNVLTDPASLTTVLPATIVATLDPDGSFSIDLPASDDPDVSPTGWTYRVTENFTGGRSDYAITVPVAAKPTGIDLAAVAPNPTAFSGGTQTFVLLAAHEALAARVTTLEAGGGGTTPTSIPHPLTLTSTAAGGYDTTDTTSRLTVQSYQTNGNNFFGEGLRFDLMRPLAKNMIAWRLPRDPTKTDPATLRSVAWVGAHYYAQDQPDINNPTDVHGHWSVEVPDAGDALRTRLEIGFVNPATKAIGVDKTNIKTNLADLTVRAESGQVLRVGAGNAFAKDLVFAIDDGTSNTGSRWIFRANTTTETAAHDGTDLQLLSARSDGTTQPVMLIIRKNGRVAVGNTGPAAKLHVTTADPTEPVALLEATTTTPNAAIQLFQAAAGAFGAVSIQSSLAGEAGPRFQVGISGRMEWGSGAATRDVNLYRRGADILGTDDTVFLANQATAPGTPTGGGHLYVTGGALVYRGSAGTVTTIGPA